MPLHTFRLYVSGVLRLHRPSVSVARARGAQLEWPERKMSRVELAFLCVCSALESKLEADDFHLR